MLLLPQYEKFFRNEVKEAFFLNEDVRIYCLVIMKFRNKTKTAVAASRYFTGSRYHEARQLIESLMLALRAKDEYTFNHSVRVARYSAAIATEMFADTEIIADAYISGLLHDIGKISIPDAVLFKNGKLTDEEYRIIQSHPIKSAEICRPINAFVDILPAIRYHHERYDGKGYPDGLAGEGIPMLARVIAVADTFDAITSDRPYRRHLPISKVWSILKDGAGSQWDVNVVEALKRIYNGNIFVRYLLATHPWCREGLSRRDDLRAGTVFENARRRAV